MKGELFFEGIQDSAVNILNLKYDSETDSFYQLSQITSNNYLNRKVTGSYIDNYPLHDYKIILWETNQNGNWDIAFSVDSGDGWTAPGIYFNSVEDELDPSFAFHPYFFFYNNNQYQVVYSKGSSIFLYTKDTVATEELIFEGNDTIKYSNPVYTDAWEFKIAAAESRINGGSPYIVYRQKSNMDSAWGEIREAFRRASAINPKFIVADYTMALSFEVLFDGKRKVIWINLDDLRSSNTVHELLDDQSLETSDFFTLELPQIVTKRGDYNDSYNPYTFRFVRNDSTFIRVLNNNTWSSIYSDYYTRVGDSHSALGALGFYNYYGIISYTIWEDSSDGRINLFGIKRINPYGDVKMPFPIRFSLSQNYPNPFNPRTKIQYAVGNLPDGKAGRQFVSLKIYDILGKEIITLVNEEKLVGVYEVEFNGSNLSSGIYFYQLKAGSLILTKKMIYLK
jgi:hypothetical protein